MPLTSTFESYERPGHIVRSPQVVYEGTVGYWEDKSIGGFIIAQCLKADTGGLVYITEDIIQTNEGPAIIACSPQDLAEQILPGLNYQLEIIDEHDEYGKLIIQHIMPDGQINSLN